MQVVFRTDASLQIGTGHIMRCLTLADALKDQGANIGFISREHPGNLNAFIKSKGYTVFVLPIEDKSDNLDGGLSQVETKETLFHADWLGASQEQDANVCETILENIKPNWLIVDHYAIDYRWQEMLKSCYKKLMVIDDLADRQHLCDVLLDQTFGREATDYKPLVPEHCQLLLGSLYALLRPEFAQWRKYSLQRRVKPELKNLLITMGGVDPDNITAQILQALKLCKLPDDLTIIVVLGQTAPHLESVKQVSKTMPYKMQVSINVNNMAELMANSDLAIGAAGATTWERCCLGVPTIQIVIADNQIKIAETLYSINAISYIQRDRVNSLNKYLKNLVNEMAMVSLISSVLVDGIGSNRIVENLFNKNDKTTLVTLNPMSNNDCMYLYSLQSTKGIRKYSRNPTIPTVDEHKKWFKKILKSNEKVLFTILKNNEKAGMLRLDELLSGEMEISIIVDPLFSGNGIAQKAISLALSLLPHKQVNAVLHSNNIASKKVFEKLNFKFIEKKGDWLTYTYSQLTS